MHDGRLAIGDDTSPHQVRLYSVTGPTVKATKQFTGHASYVYSVALVGEELVSGSGDKTVRFWNTSTGSAKKATVDDSVYAVALTPQLIIAGTWSSSMYVWKKEQFGGSAHKVIKLSSQPWAFKVDDDRLIVGSFSGGRLSMWRLSDLESSDSA